MQLQQITAEQFEIDITDAKADGVFVISKENCAPCEPFKKTLEANNLNITEVLITEQSGLPFGLLNEVTSFPALVRVCGGEVQETVHLPSIENAKQMLALL